MKYIVIAVSSAIFTVILLVIYKYVLNPQIVVPIDGNSMAMCPDRWTYDSDKQVCEPQYSTHCLPFNPKAQTLTTPAEKCALAKRCNTDWSGLCQ